jgi:hypothetical protein
VAENTEPTVEETETPEVEAHSSVLDLQGIKKAATSENSCVSTISFVGDSV